MDPTNIAQDPETRLEAALERIARHVETPDPIATEVAARLDTLITTLRDALESEEAAHGASHG